MELSQRTLVFGECRVHEKKDVTLDLRNPSSADMAFEFETGAYFHAHPKKGKLVAGGIQNVVVTYAPLALGKHDKVLSLKIHGDLQQVLRLPCYAQAPRIGQKSKAKTRGLEALPGDFARPGLNLVSASNLKLPKEKPKNEDGFEELTKMMKNAKGDVEDFNLITTLLTRGERISPYALSPRGIQDVLANRRHYDGHQKEYEKKEEISNPLTVMEESNGMHSPRLKLSEVGKDPVWLIRPTKHSAALLIDKEGGEFAGVTGRKFLPDENKVMKKKFKKAPTTMAEIRDCARELTEKELAFVITSSNVVDVGTINVKSAVTKSFWVFNDLPQNVHVELGLEEHEELRAQSRPGAQVIPSAKDAGFDIVFQSNASGSFMKTVSVSINGQKNVRKFQVKANVVPVDLNLSSDGMRFAFLEDSLEQTVSETIQLGNSGNGPASFVAACHDAHGCFQVEPSGGVVAPGHAKVTLKATFTPPEGVSGVVEGFLSLKIQDGTERMVRLTGMAEETACTVNQKKLEFGQIPVGVAGERTVTLTNTGMHAAVFHVVELPNGVIVSPMRGKVGLEGSVDLTVKILYEAPKKLENGNLTVALRGGKAIRIPISAQSVIPDLAIIEEELDFGRVILGASEVRTVTIENTSTAVEGQVFLNVAAPFALVSGHAGKLLIAPGEKVELKVAFTPTELGEILMDFPISIPGSRLPETMRRKMKAECIKPRILFSQTVIDFKSKTVLSAEKSAPAITEIVIELPEAIDESEATRSAVRWQIDTSRLDKLDRVITVEPNSGLVTAEKKNYARVAFLPSEAKEYEVMLPVYISPENASSPGARVDSRKAYMTLRVQGVGTSPRVELGDEEVVFEPVSTGEKVSRVITLRNSGYDNAQVRHFFPEDLAHVPISVNYPEGTHLGGGDSSIPVEIVFQADKPISLVCKVAFGVGERKSAFLRVVAVADNSVMTTDPLPPSTAVNPAGGAVHVPDFFVRWMNGTLLRTSVERFPEDVITQQGKQLFETVELLSGKSMTPAAGAPGSGKVTRETYEALLKFLIAHGALMGGIRPEDFLTFEAYTKFKAAQSGQGAAGVAVTEAEQRKKFAETSNEAWNVAFMQTVKLFMVNRVTAKAFKKAVHGETIDMHTSGHAQNSVAQTLLLRWLEHFNRKVFGGGAGETLEQFKRVPLSAFAAALKHYVPDCASVASYGVGENQEQQAAKIITSLKELDLVFPISIADLLKNDTKVNLLFTYFLYENLPHFQPKTEAVFAAELGVDISRTIEIANPSKKPIVYHVHLIQDPPFNFAVNANTLRIEPKSKGLVTVDFKSRFTKDCGGVLRLTSRREGNVYATPVVVKLGAKCTNRRISKTVNMASSLFVTSSMDVEVTNVYKEEGEFAVGLVQTGAADCFFIQSDLKLKLKAGETGKITLHYLPMEMSTYQAQLTFVDAKVGEFYYEVNGTTTLPGVLENFQLQCKADETLNKELTLSYRNSQLDSALSWVDQFQKRRNSVAYPSSLTYEVKCNNAKFFEFPKTLTLTKEAGAGTGNNLKVLFKPREPGTYVCEVKLISKFDVRVFSVSAVALTPNSHFYIDFETYARRPVSQDVQISNNSNADWVLKAQFVPVSTSTLFEAPRDLVVKKNTTANYEIKFSPDWIVEGVKTDLVLTNVTLNEVYEYHLTGSAQEPLAEDHVVLRARAREKSVVKIPVRNFQNVQTVFSVETGLGDEVAGDPLFQLEANQVGQYELVLRPLKAGKRVGSLTFKDASATGQTSRYLWLSVELIVDPPKPEEKLKLSCEVRQGVMVDVSLANPLGKQAVFAVTYTNGVGLSGDLTFTVPPYSSANYELIYNPMKPANEVGGQLKFISDLLGEVWYELELTALASKPMNLGLMECELGRTSVQSIRIENPIDMDVILKPSSSNKVNFRIKQAEIAVSALEAAEFEVEFVPSSFKETSANIVLEHPSVGNWTYTVRGMGLTPSEVVPVSIVAQIGRPSPAAITFKNPLLEKLDLQVSLVSETSNKGVFELVGVKRQLCLRPLEQTQIPFSFQPDAIKQHIAKLELQAVNEPAMLWKYRISGVAEAPADAAVHSFSTEARKPLEALYPLTLVGLAENAEDVGLAVTVEVDKTVEKTVKKCLKVEVLESEKKNEIVLGVLFAPMKPMAVNGYLIVTSKNGAGGRWRFNVKLEATAAAPDDLIVIEAPLNKTASVSFRLPGTSEGFANFKAYFDEDSPGEFSVSPASGALEPKGRPGTQFVVKYRPTEYGSLVNGRLLVETEDMLWCFQVKGAPPAYVPPTNTKARIVTRLSADVEEKLNKKKAPTNFIKANSAALGK